MDLTCLPLAAKPLAWDLLAPRVASPQVLVIHQEQPNPQPVTPAPVRPQTPFHLRPRPPPVTVHPPPVTPCPAPAPPPPTQSAAPSSPLAPTASRCTTRRHNNQPSLSLQTTQADEQRRREVTLRDTRTPPGPPTPGSRAPGAWAAGWRRPVAPPTPGAGCPPVPWGAIQSTLATSCPKGWGWHRPPMTLVTELSKLKWRICSGCMRSTTTRRGEPGWTSCSASWRRGAPPSASAPPSARTPSTSTGSTSSPRTAAASSSAPTRRRGRTLRPSWASDLPHRGLTP